MRSQGEGYLSETIDVQERHRHAVRRESLPPISKEIKTKRMGLMASLTEVGVQ